MFTSQTAMPKLKRRGVDTGTNPKKKRKTIDQWLRSSDSRFNRFNKVQNLYKNKKI